MKAPQIQTCGRRMLDWGPWEKAENLDLWQDRGQGYESCSFCGSLKPETLLEWIEERICEIGPTDKDYKIYVTTLIKTETKFYFQHFTTEQQDKFIDLVNAKVVKFGYPGYFYVLPYFATRAAPKEVNNANGG